jgi:heat shock protein HslJ
MPGGCVQVSWDIQGTANLIQISRGQDIINESQAPRNTITDCPPGTENPIYQIQAISAAGKKTRTHTVTIIPATPTQSSPLIRDWELLFYLGDDGEYHTLIPESRITTSFFVSNNISGFSGCNTYESFYIQKDQGDLIIDPPIISDRACTMPENVMVQEATYASMLETVTSYLVVSDRLELYNADGQIILVFSPCSPDSCP